MKKEQLMEEKALILEWMESHPHPSQFSVWNDYVDSLSKEWTKKSNQLKAINCELQKVSIR